MRLEGTKRVQGMCRRALGFGEHTCEPGSDPFDVYEQDSLLEMSPVTPDNYFWLEVHYGGGKKEYWYSDKKKWQKAKNLKEAEKLSNIEDATKEYKKKVEDDHRNFERSLSMQRGDLMRAWSVSTNEEKAALAEQIADFMKEK